MRRYEYTRDCQRVARAACASRDQLVPRRSFLLRPPFTVNIPASPFTVFYRRGLHHHCVHVDIDLSLTFD